MTSPPSVLTALVDRYDADAFTPERAARVRLAVDGTEAWDAVLRNGTVTLGEPRGEPDATLTADLKTWTGIADDLRGGMRAYQAGRLRVRRNLHVGVGFLAATGGAQDGRRLVFRTLYTPRARISILEAGSGPPVVALHGLGATKGSFLPTVAALSPRFRIIAIDLPGFGDSDKPIGAAYDAPYFANAVVDALDALGLERAHVVGNSMGGRVAIEVGLTHPNRVNRIALLAPSLAWRRERPWAPLLKLVRPELGLIQLAPRPVVEGVVHRLIPGAADGWAAAGVDEFLRAYLTRSGRAAFYAAARHIYLEEPEGERGFWTRLPSLQPPALFVWGLRDKLVPIAFERHVAQALPAARHLELDCGHVPQIERSRETHQALGAFLAPSP